MSKILEVSVIHGDLVEIVVKDKGETREIRRHIADYDTLSDEAKQQVWRDIVGHPDIEFQSNLTRIKNIFKR